MSLVYQPNNGNYLKGRTHTTANSIPSRTNRRCIRKLLYTYTKIHCFCGEKWDLSVTQSAGPNALTPSSGKCVYAYAISNLQLDDHVETFDLFFCLCADKNDLFTCCTNCIGAPERTYYRYKHDRTLQSHSMSRLVE